jgi:hypothetical protein
MVDPDQQLAFQQALLNAGVPVNLAQLAATVMAKDDPHAPHLGRSDEDMHIVRSAHTWMRAKGFFNR